MFCRLYATLPTRPSLPMHHAHTQDAPHRVYASSTASDSMGPFSPLSATAAAALASLPTMAGSRYAARIVRTALIDMMAKSSHNLLLLLSELPIAVSVIIHSLVR